MPTQRQSGARFTLATDTNGRTTVLSCPIQSPSPTRLPRRTNIIRRTMSRRVPEGAIEQSADNGGPRTAGSSQIACIALRSSGDLLAHRVSDLRLSSSTGTWVRRATGPWPDGDHHRRRLIAPRGAAAASADQRRIRFEHPSDPGGVQVVPQTSPRLEPSIRPGTSRRW